ncbi:Hypothetical predicted protein [Mytilus galloprovincialis]|uniref:R-spondin Fu-CRD domain-containing protein n=1 Tax=Mytilus galloprovincialis TaxID=29158 RepID=A0A8B6H821_MYTGA|nr:Hypothetical predicted protein [Mytilus galloprovincialis]
MRLLFLNVDVKRRIMECQLEHCNACFSNSYCTQCKHPYISYRGRCTESCPDGLYYANYSKDCRLLVDCMAGPWSSWTPCARNGQTCGYKYGITTRSREILEHPSPNGATCPSLVENRCCRMEMRHCADYDLLDSLTVTTPGEGQCSIDNG